MRSVGTWWPRAASRISRTCLGRDPPRSLGPSLRSPSSISSAPKSLITGCRWRCRWCGTLSINVGGVIVLPRAHYRSVKSIAQASLRPDSAPLPSFATTPQHSNLIRLCRTKGDVHMKVLSKRRLLGAATLGLVALAAAMGSQALAGSKDGSASAKGLGPISGLLPRDHLTEESAIQVDLSKESVRLPLYQGVAYKGTPNEEKVWFVLLDASDQGLAHDLGVNYAPKLANIGINDPDAVQTVTLESPTPDQNKFGQAVVDFQGAPDFSPTRIAEPGPTGFPLARFQPGAVAGPGYSPFIRIAGSQTVYSAPIVATGEGPFDVVHHTNTGDRVLGVHIAGQSAPGQFAESWVDLLFVKGFDAGQPIIYISTDAGQPLTAVLERSTLVPALDQAAYNGVDDFLGSARERLFGFINGRTGADNKQAQGFVHLATDGHLAEDASDQNTAQIDAVQVFNLAASRPDLLTGVDPASGQPAPYGSVGVDINCAVIGFTAKAPTANLADPLPNSQFPPR